jgi:hypothetical protein
VSVVVQVDLNGVRVPVVLDDAAIAVLVDAVAARTEPEPASESPYMTIPEAALYLGCGHRTCPRCKDKPPKRSGCRRCSGSGRIVNRQAVDDLLSRGALPRLKRGRRTSSPEPTLKPSSEPTHGGADDRPARFGRDMDEFAGSEWRDDRPPLWRKPCWVGSGG